jgi:hypothetical protein
LGGRRWGSGLVFIDSEGDARQCSAGSVRGWEDSGLITEVEMEVMMDEGVAVVRHSPVQGWNGGFGQREPARFCRRGKAQFPALSSVKGTSPA